MSLDALSVTSPAAPRDLHDVVGWIDARVVDPLGERLGRVSAVLADRDGRPWWLVVRRRGRTLLAPVAAVEAAGHGCVVLCCLADELVATDGAPMTDEIHEALILRFGLDRRRAPGRRRGGCPPAGDRRRKRGD